MKVKEVQLSNLTSWTPSPQADTQRLYPKRPHERKQRDAPAEASNIHQELETNRKLGRSGGGHQADALISATASPGEMLDPDAGQQHAHKNLTTGTTYGQRHMETNIPRSEARDISNRPAIAEHHDSSPKALDRPLRREQQQQQMLSQDATRFYKQQMFGASQETTKQVGGVLRPSTRQLDSSASHSSTPSHVTSGQQEDCGKPRFDPRELAPPEMADKGCCTEQHSLSQASPRPKPEEGSPHAREGKTAPPSPSQKVKTKNLPSSEQELPHEKSKISTELPVALVFTANSHKDVSMHEHQKVQVGSVWASASPSTVAPQSFLSGENGSNEFTPAAQSVAPDTSPVSGCRTANVFSIHVPAQLAISPQAEVYPSPFACRCQEQTVQTHRVKFAGSGPQNVLHVDEARKKETSTCQTEGAKHTRRQSPVSPPEGNSLTTKYGMTLEVPAPCSGPPAHKRSSCTVQSHKEQQGGFLSGEKKMVTSPLEAAGCAITCSCPFSCQAHQRFPACRYPRRNVLDDEGLRASHSWLLPETARKNVLLDETLPLQKHGRRDHSKQNACMCSANSLTALISLRGQAPEGSSPSSGGKLTSQAVEQAEATRSLLMEAAGVAVPSAPPIQETASSLSILQLSVSPTLPSSKYTDDEDSVVVGGLRRQSPEPNNQSKIVLGCWRQATDHDERAATRTKDVPSGHCKPEPEYYCNVRSSSGHTCRGSKFQAADTSGQCSFGRQPQGFSKVAKWPALSPILCYEARESSEFYCPQRQKQATRFALQTPSALNLKTRSPPSPLSPKCTCWRHEVGLKERGGSSTPNAHAHSEIASLKPLASEKQKPFSSLKSNCQLYNSCSRSPGRVEAKSPCADKDAEDRSSAASTHEKAIQEPPPTEAIIEADESLGLSSPVIEVHRIKPAKSTGKVSAPRFLSRLRLPVSLSRLRRRSASPPVRLGPQPAAAVVVTNAKSEKTFLLNEALPHTIMVSSQAPEKTRSPMLKELLGCASAQLSTPNTRDEANTEQLYCLQEVPKEDPCNSLQVDHKPKSTVAGAAQFEGHTRDVYELPCCSRRSCTCREPRFLTSNSHSRLPPSDNSSVLNLQSFLSLPLEAEDVPADERCKRKERPLFFSPAKASVEGALVGARRAVAAAVSVLGRSSPRRGSYRRSRHRRVRRGHLSELLGLTHSPFTDTLQYSRDIGWSESVASKSLATSETPLGLEEKEVQKWQQLLRRNRELQHRR
ncbi:hypothetical protein Efla_000991 [Eimeria flavescens]